MSGSEGSRRGPEPEALADPEPRDLRLLPVAVGLWAGIGAVLAWLPDRPLSVAAASAALMVVAAVIWVLSGRVGSRRGRTGARVEPVVAVLSGLGGLCLGALHLVALHPPLATEVAAASAVVRVTAKVIGDPVAHPPSNPQWGTAPSWTVELQLTQVRYRGRSYAVSLPALGRGLPAATLHHGARIEASARAAPAWSPQRHALSLQLLGTVQQRAPPGHVAEATNTVRASFRAAVAGLPADAGALLLGLAVGDESTLPTDLDEAMVSTGLSHLTAVSGSNTSLVVGIALGAVTLLGLGWRTRVLVCAIVLALYVALVRPQPSVLRAAVMGCVALLAFTAGGRRRGPPALLAAVIGLLVWMPELALSWGFALSVAATAGLLLIGPGLGSRLSEWRVSRGLPEPLRAAFAVALAAHLATLPLAVGLGNGASWVALPANIIVVPVVPWATVMGLAAALISPAVPTLAAGLAWVGAPATALIAWVARTADAVPLGEVAVPQTPAAMVAAAVLVAVAVRLMLSSPRSPWLVIPVAACLVVSVVWWRIRDRAWPPPHWSVLACDVGQGDGVLLRAAGAGEAVLVDVGPATADVAACARDAGIDRVTVLLTHFHADHVDGLAPVLAGLDVSAILTTPVPDPPAAAQRVVDLARAAEVPVRTLRAGQSLDVAGARIQVLWPARRMPDPNNSSLVMLARLPAAERPLSVLLTGDVEPLAQAALLARGLPDVDVMKVPHHGSRYQDPGLASATRPEVALVCVGVDNDYGHPAPETLSAYARAGTRVGRTDTQGALAVVAEGAGAVLVTQR